MMPATFFNTITSWFFPPLCVHCQREGAWLCSEAQAIVATEPVFQETITLPNIDQVFIRGSYDCLVLQQLIYKLKYAYWSAASGSLSGVLEPLVAELRRLPPDTVIVPVPLHARRIRERGYNQSFLIAEALGQLTGWPIRPLLQRHRYTVPQAQLSEKRRQTNVVDAFVLQHQLEQIPSSAILVDDVLTTGSTLSECAKVLRQNNIVKIYACTLAKG